jgi:5-methylcytosine-specific restriction endonuclease McrA
MYTETLVLNQQYRPHEIMDWKDAITAMFKGKVEVLVSYDEIVARIDRQTLATFPELRRALRQVIGTDAEALDIKVPAVVVLRRRVSLVKDGVKFSKVNVCLRDDFTCQYCGVALPMSKLNYDHVIPRSRGGKTCWENIVIACYACNQRKRNLTLEEAGMKLLSKPVKPKALPMSEPYIDRRNVPDEWAPFVSVKLDETA